MAGLVKKFSLLVFILSVLCLSSCVNHSAVIKENAEEMMQCIIDRDAEKLLTFFSADMQENEFEETLEEIEKLFDGFQKILCKSKTNQTKVGLQSKRNLGFPLDCPNPAG